MSELPVVKIKFPNGATGLYEILGSTPRDISCRALDLQVNLIGVSVGNGFIDLSSQSLEKKKLKKCSEFTAARGVLSHPALAPLFAEQEEKIRVAAEIEAAKIMAEKKTQKQNASGSETATSAVAVSNT